MSTISRITERINSWTGYCEKASRAYLDDFTANAGSGNYTCFGRDYTKLVNDGYDWNGEPWCDMFIDTCFVQAFGREKARELLGGFSAYTPTSAQYFKNLKQWYTGSPQEGDIIFFTNSSGTICHTGYVRGVDGNYVYTTEGNTSSSAGVVDNGGCVAQKCYSKNYSRIAGYGRPDYSIIEEEMTMTQYEELKAEISALKEENQKLKDTIGGTFIYNYIDSNMPSWAKEAVKWCVDNKIISGTNKNGDLGLNHMKLWVCVVLYRAAKVIRG